MFPDATVGKVITVRFSRAADTGGVDLQAATAGYKVRILSGLFVGGAAGATFRLQSGGTTDLFDGSVVLAANATLVLPPNPSAWEETAAGEKLNLAVDAGLVHGTLRVQLVK